ncbi:hypothetical protein SAMN05421595_0807 [Austwickia chelonae]|uniref:Uncharacterized protein n=1 Tax=Austwickia chelonae NBRC 105200 TaxID=1184607 RepID=K6VSG9_9MICO|nr:hypothetical protein [Austwickia chelonae]GAB78290.1 hypothetical protein AUCHE_08_05360 [Austwickia chelonae NBRC 105200]SEW00563.1 hypothetical protein SAMN05421595_0807 [Austwickia chelonae]
MIMLTTKPVCYDAGLGVFGDTTGLSAVVVPSPVPVRLLASAVNPFFRPWFARMGAPMI